MKKVVQYFLYVCFSPRGRINRTWFWLYVLPVWGLHFYVVDVVSQWDPFLATLNFSVVNVVFLYLSIVVRIKRFHDLNRSGWNVLWMLFPFFGAFYILIVCGLAKGTEREHVW